MVLGKVNEQFDLIAPDNNMSRAAIEGWIPLERAQALFKMAGLDYDAAKKQALTREFKPVPLGAPDPGFPGVRRVHSVW